MICLFFPLTGMDTLRHGGTGRSMQSRLCWKNAGISWEREELFVKNYANALCNSVSPMLAPRWVDWFQISLFSYFSIVDFSTGIKIGTFLICRNCCKIMAKSCQNYGKLESQNILLYFHSWGWNKWVSSFEGDEDEKIKYENGDDPCTHSSKCQVLGKTYLSVTSTNSY